jgi:GNAT superfamily N-acetyltransferase
MTVSIRDFDPSMDTPAALSFIRGSQVYEQAFEANRRIDPPVAEEYFAALMNEVGRNEGRVFVARTAARAIGWAVFVTLEDPVFVIAEHRRYGYIAELFVVEDARGGGVGRALIGACEDEARRRGLSHVKIGLLTANARAAGIYARAGYSPYHSELRKYL